MKPFVGYPGGKSRAAGVIKELLPGAHNATGYCEPFAGGFSFGLSLLEEWRPDDVWINEYDPDMYSLWYMVLKRPSVLCQMVQAATITSETFYELQKRILTNRYFRRAEIPQRALDKLVIHKISFSNMGEMSGSPVGGKHQTGKWKFDVRWKPDLICKSIMRVSEFLRGARITRHNYARVLDMLSGTFLVYLDPPYVEAGKKCYKHAFNEDDHRYLANRLKSVKFQWFMTYDNHPLVHELYPWASIQPFNFKYFMSSAYRSKDKMKDGSELLITSANLV
jgi:DNA adenine methylase